jgi:hypothetical protein
MHTLLTFVNKSYEYNGECDIRDKGLTIGGHRSVWLAALVTAFMLENTTEHFNETAYDGIYRDAGLVIMDGVKTNNEIGEWLSSF